MSSSKETLRSLSVSPDGKAPGHRGEAFHGRGTRGRSTFLESEPHANVEEMLRETKPCSPSAGPDIEPFELPQLRQDYEEFAAELPVPPKEALPRVARETLSGDHFHDAPREGLPSHKGESHLLRQASSKQIPGEQKQQLKEQLKKMHEH
ncbi:hypothetical protein RCL1_001916 [Eukaryota sp. TZLM3-RCL]